jgi:plastocyanin
LIKRSLIALAALALASFALAACGGSDSSSSTSSTAASTAGSTSSTSSGAAASSGGSSTISISADPSGALAFEQTDVSAAAGKDTLDFTNDSSTPHDVVIEDSSGNQVAATDVIQGSNTSTAADLKAGSYTFFCSLPGHREAGMEGTITVK